jgi:small subunit ribosomal protein S18
MAREQRGDRGDRGDRGAFRRYFPPKRKVCRFCQRNVREIDYKNVDILKRYILERGKISPRRVSGTCSYHQRRLSTAIKRARILALLPFLED